MFLLNKHIYIYTFLSIILLSSCQNVNSDENIVESPTVDTITITNEKNSNTFSFADSIKINKVIDIKIPDSLPFASIYNVSSLFFIQDTIYLFENKFMSIRKFDSKGNYIKDIGRLGNKAGEFIKIQDVKYNPLTNSLWVLCNTPLKIIEFSTNGDLIKEHKIPFFASNMAFPKGNDLYFYTNNNTNNYSGKKEILYTDKSYKIKNSIFDSPPSRYSIMNNGGLFMTSNNTILFNKPFKNNIYDISYGKARNLYYVDFGLDNNFPDKFTDQEISEFQTKKTAISTPIVESEYLIGFMFYKSLHSNIALYNKKNKYVYRSDFGTNNKDSLFNGQLLDTQNGFVLLLNPYIVSKFNKDYKQILYNNNIVLNERLLQSNNRKVIPLILFSL